MSKDIIIKVEELKNIIDNRIRIGIGLPVGRDVNSEFLKMIFERIGEWMQKYIITILIDKDIPIDLSRNNIVNLAKRYNCDYLFFIDSDILIEEGQLERLLSHNKDVISGVYYQKLSPYYALPRKRVSENIYQSIEIDSTEFGNNIIEIDGSGMGCFLIKMGVFDKISYPWFEFKYCNIDGKWGQLSEDLYFCQKLQNIGIKIYCDPIVQCTHLGIQINTELVHAYKDARTSTLKNMDVTANELSEFVCMSPHDVRNRWMSAHELVAKEYREFIQQNHTDPKDFYKINKNYVFDLTNWHMAKRRTFDIKLPTSIKENYPFAKKILDFGCGCGQNAIDLASSGYEVAMSDYEGYTSQFAKFRTKKRGLNIKFYDIEKPINDTFDIILAFDVLEYVPDDEFKKTTDLLKSLRSSRGRILTSITFGNQDGTYPMRYDASPEKFELIEKLNDIDI